MDIDNKLRVLVVDDAAFMRKAVTGILASDPGIEVVGEAVNGLEALEKIRALKPDIVTLDIDMPVMDGLSAIRHIMIESPLPIVALSSLISDGAATFEALRLGVVDFIPKPSGAVSNDIDTVKQLIINRVKVAKAVNLENLRRVRLNGSWEVSKRLEVLYNYQPLEYVIAIGTNLAGPNTVIRLVSKLLPTLPAAVIVSQEISPRIIDSFARKFNEHVPWRVMVAQDGMTLEQGTCYLSSNENAVGMEEDFRGEPCLRVAGRTEAPLNHLFASSAEMFHQNSIGVLLSGTGKDGTEGFASINKKYGTTIAQNTECCVYPNLTQHAIQAGVVDLRLDENQLTDGITSIMV
ncbi:MAG: response regulator [Desulfosarcina sp.]|nr:response regulator [Desulfobacterales bacterium]